MQIKNSRWFVKNSGEPIGDPFGGPAYGKRQDPVTAVVASIAADWAAATTVAEMVAVAATVATDVGVVLEVAGAVTGDKNLMATGGDFLLVGGVGSMVSAGMNVMAENAGSQAISNGATAAITDSYINPANANTLTDSAIRSATQVTPIATDAGFANAGNGLLTQNAIKNIPQVATTTTPISSAPSSFYTNPVAGNAVQPTGNTANTDFGNAAPQVGNYAQTALNLNPSLPKADVAFYRMMDGGASEADANAVRLAIQQSGGDNILKSTWDSFGDHAKAAVIQAGVSVLGGIYTGQVQARQADIQQQNANTYAQQVRQNSYGGILHAPPV